VVDEGGSFARDPLFACHTVALEVYNQGKPMDQIKFEFPRDEDEPERKRYKRRKPLPPPKAVPPPQDQALVGTPVVQRCGFCGEKQTLMGETHVCTNCGGILVRCEEEDL
jgi:hypothetical protein